MGARKYASGNRYPAKKEEKSHSSWCHCCRCCLSTPDVRVYTSRLFTNLCCFLTTVVSVKNRREFQVTLRGTKRRIGGKNQDKLADFYWEIRTSKSQMDWRVRADSWSFTSFLIPVGSSCPLRTCWWIGAIGYYRQSQMKSIMGSFLTSGTIRKMHIKTLINVFIQKTHRRNVK